MGRSRPTPRTTDRHRRSCDPCEAGLFFANADTVRDRIDNLATATTHLVVLDAETSPFIDFTAVRMLYELRDSLARRAIELRIARDVGQFRDVIHSIDAAEPLRLYASVSAAVNDGPT